ncbi:SDR family NAD(P)-dependent oxidoreductase [Amycolatopsis sp., V23-08]|uniref:SDR family NAD(P)-dependent oxidoreductase n=1 Tax=Amycolatopsis heterodermiae TaxID=3110235 RepID=A0ABU5R3D1_9PSEU|nr:SDR family NAD(P)-dependent oxidoreductase [Amycolatopsis sp., V23-08]MEA5360344.1 SDR family NAD(P)-dependent oxidoreductase [Amycolatopsis sp., V23-08]
MTATVDGPVAVVGIGCRFPGAGSPSEYWDLVREGRDAVGDAPPDRRRLNSASPRRGGFLTGIDRFDAGFFGIAAAEAARMDPQQRLVLEVAWSALEDAAIAPESLAGSHTGVFVGLHSQSSDYYWMQSGGVDAHTGTGTAHGMVAGRLAYTLDLRGPALTVDTACSSALVAVHLAMRSLRAGECEVAVVGGVNLMLTGLFASVGEQMGLLSPSGGCHPFDASADGIVSGEGCGAVVLKPLAAARAAGDRVLGVLLGSAVGQDGRGNGLTAPNPLAQIDVVTRALDDAGVAADRVSYVEAHGTGTLLGDPIELDALSEVFGAGLPALGSVKANLGHLEGAAGMAALIKLLLMLRHGEIPKQPHFTEPNPNIEVPGYPECVPVETAAWPGADRIGGVSAFGWSGTNAHLVVGEPPAVAPPTEADGPELLTLSARSEPALRALASAYADALSTADSVPDLCRTANTGRQAMRHRLALPVSGRDEAVAALAAFGAGEDAPGTYAGEAGKRPKVAFLFSGQGAHYLGMGRELLRTEPVFADAVRACDRLAARWLPPGAVESVIAGTAGEHVLADTRHAQLALVTVQVALARLWRSWGVTPAAVLGHSVGEFAAAHVAGALSLEDCLLLVGERARLMHELPEGGGMTAVHAPPEQVAVLLDGLTDGLSVGALNAPGTTVVSGFAAHLDRLEARLDAVAVRYRRLTVSHAFHSPLVEPVLDRFAAATGGVRHRRPQVPLVAGATGALLTAADLDGGYWVRQMREPVRFTDAMATLAARGCTVFVEVGPGSTLVGLGRACVPEDAKTWVPSLRSARPAQHLDALGQVFTAGVRIRWDDVYRDRPRRRVPLPGYPFERQSYWLPAHSAVQPEQDTFTVEWREAARVARGGSRRLLVVDTSGELVESLRARGADATLVEELAFDGEPVDLVLRWPGDPREGVELVLAALRAVDGKDVRLSLVTQGAQPAGGQPVEPEPAVWWGLGRTLAMEHPELRVRLLDGADAGELAEEILSGDPEPQVVLAGGRRYVPRLVPAPRGGEPVAIRPDGAYLVTGGLGGLGLETADWLVTAGARHLVLLSRKEPPADTLSRMDGWRAGGVTVDVVAADVSDEAALDAVFARFGARLRGVVHAAGVVRDRALVHQDWARFDEVFAAKVRGARLLHERTVALSLDFFVLFSSAAAVLGSPGQANYAAANAYLDALAHHRAGRGLPATVLDWGPWERTGMAARLDADSARRWTAAGVRPLTPAHGLGAFGRAVRAGAAQAVVLTVDWDTYRAGRGAHLAASLLAELGAAAPAEPVRAETGAPLARQLAELPPAQRRPALVRRLATLVGGFVPSGTPVDTAAGFFDLGMDSLQATELRNTLVRELGRPLPATLVFESPTVDSLAATLLAGTSAPAVAAPRPESGPVPIAVVGLGCRFPGADSPEAFWRLLADGVDATREVPEGRWPGGIPVGRGGFLDAVDGFDPEFFGISPREAEKMDPQHRLLLEVCWETAEHAGIPVDSLAARRAGLFVGLGSHDYELRRARAGAEADAYSGTGNPACFAAGRVSHLLNLTGPAMTLDTACSSSLLAVHLAAQSLRLGECDAALAGGVSLMLAPENFHLGVALHALSPDGRCKPFDAAADGYARGEGCGMVLLKRLPDALADGDRVLGVLKGSATNHDGRSSGLRVPSGAAQRRLLADALAAAGAAPSDVDYVEAQGTGSDLGDPIEAAALAEVYGTGRDRPLLVGSVKANIGHLEAASGVAGLIKVLLALRHGTAPAQLNLTTPNPKIDAGPEVLRLGGGRQDWTAPAGRPRLAGVSSFGLSGTNVHVLVEEAPPVAAGESAPVERAGDLLVLSARSEAALRDHVRRYLDVVTAPDAPEPADLAHAAACARTHLPHRLAVVASSSADAGQQLREFLAGSVPAFAGTAGIPPTVTMVFGDPGAAFAGFGALPATEPAWQRAIAEGEVALGVPGALARPEALLRERPELRSAVTVALQYAYAELFRSWGVVPAAVAGAGAAACVAGTASLREVLSSPVQVPRQAESGIVLRIGAGERATGEPLELLTDLAEPAEAPADRARAVAAALHVRGVALDWARVQPRGAAGRVDLPTYPFQRSRYWEELTPREETPWPGRRVPTAGRERVFTRTVGVDTPVLRDHRVFGEVVVPGAWYVSAALGAVRALGEQRPELRNVSFRQALTVRRGEDHELQVVLDPRDGRFEISASPAPDCREWTVHAGGSFGTAASAAEPLTAGEPAGDGWRAVGQDELYQGYAAAGGELGPAFQYVRRAWVREAEAVAEMHAVDGDGAPPPGLVDSCCQLLLATFFSSGAWVPVSVDRVLAYEPVPVETWAVARLAEHGETGSTGDVHLLAADGRVVLALHGVRFHRVDRTFAGAERALTRRWEVDDEPAEPPAPQTWLLFAEPGTPDTVLAEAAAAAGIDVVRVRAGHAPRRHDAARSVDPADAEAVRDVVTAVVGEHGDDLCEVVYLARGEDALDGCLGLRHVARALAGLAAPPRLNLLTSRTQAAAGTPRPGGAAVWGAGRAIALEHPELRTLLLDLDPAAEADPARVVDEVTAPRGGTEVALRDGRRLRATLVPADLPEKPVTIHAGAPYLVVGGPEARPVADWLRTQGATDVVLAGEPGDHPGLRGVVYADGKDLEATPLVDGEDLDFLAFLGTGDAESAAHENLAHRLRAQGRPAVSLVWDGTDTALLGRALGADAAHLLLVAPPAAAPVVTREEAAVLEPSTVDIADETVLQARLRTLVAGVMGLPATRLDPATSLHELGFDSLMAFEVKDRVERELGVEVPLGQVLERPTVAGLADLVAELTAPDRTREVLR